MHQGVSSDEGMLAGGGCMVEGRTPAKPTRPEVTFYCAPQLRRGRPTRRTAQKTTPATTKILPTGGERTSMFGRRDRPERAHYLRRSRASPEVILGCDAPAPEREASPEDSPRKQRHLRRWRLSSEERTLNVWPAAPAAKSRPTRRTRAGLAMKGQHNTWPFP